MPSHHTSPTTTGPTVAVPGDPSVGPRAQVATDRLLVPAVLVLTAVSLAGSALAVATGLSATWWEAVGPTGRLSVPLPMNAALLLLAGAARGSRGRVARPGAALLAVACGVAVVSGAFDGGYAADLDGAERVVQVVLVLTLVVVGALGARRACRPSVA